MAMPMMRMVGTMGTNGSYSGGRLFPQNCRNLRRWQKFHLLAR